MGVEFKSNDCVDVLLAAGIESNDEEIISKLYAGRFIGLTPEGKASEIQRLVPLLNAHKNTLEKISYGKFLEKVEKAFPDLISAHASKQQRVRVAVKLEELAGKREEKEKEFGVLHKFFHKINQLFHGHGFQTKAEYGKEVAKELRESTIKNLSKNLVAYITDNGSISDEIKQELDSLPQDQFKDVLDVAVFGQKQNSRLGSPKLDLYLSLSEAKKALFREQLMMRRDWFEQMHDIFQSVGNFAEAQNKISPFVGALPVEAFQEIAETLGEKIQNEKWERYNPFLCLAGIERAFQGWIADSKNKGVSSLTPIIELVGFFKYPTLVERANWPLLLTEGDVATLRKNIDSFARAQHDTTNR